ncbi:MAG: LptF/LptG family permease [Sedimentisphaerales bacterium]|nr:LptF/LptG family permease [Sedimentisphaerales bacterium]
MTYTLYKYIFRELLRVFLLALIALTLILSMGSILQPIQEFGAGPKQIFVIMFYFLPITLTFVLPIAALFAGSLVYGRFTSDNELDACRASGISIINLVIPGLFLAIVVAISNLFLSFYVMPTFVHLAEKSIKTDIKQMLFRSIEQNGYYKVPPENKYLIYADYVDNKNDMLRGVVITKLEGVKISDIFTTESAKIKIIPHKTTNEVQITIHNGYQMSNKETISLSALPFTTEFGSLLADNITFKKIDEMREIKADLMRFEPVAKNAYKTLKQFTAELFVYDIHNKISEINNNDLINENSPAQEYVYELAGEPNSVKFSLVPCTVQKEQISLTSDITLIEFNNKNPNDAHTYKCKEAFFRFEGSRNDFTLAMDIRGARDINSGEIKMWDSITGLKIPKDTEKLIKQFYTDKGSINVHKLASGLNNLVGFEPSRELKILQSILNEDIQKTNMEIKAEIHSRLVFGIGCISMILIGIGLGILKRGGHLLSAFGTSCIPAVILVVCIMSGKQLTENIGAQSLSGITVMWAGCGSLFLFAIGLYYYLLKN